MTTDTKSPWASKTLWINGLTMLGALLALLVGMQTAGELPFPISEKWVVFILALVNFALRWVTTQPIKATQ